MNSRHGAWLAIFFLVCAALALRVPLLSTQPVNWDAVQFVLGTRHFDVAAHQPHPPGYPLFVLLGSLLAPLTGDSSIALSLVALVLGAATVVPVFAVGSLLGGRRAGLVSAVIYACSPMAAYYSAVGLTYTAEGFFSALVGLLLWRAAQGARWPFIAAVATLALAGGIRPWTLLFLLPLCCMVGHSRPVRERWWAGGIGVLLTLIWLVPLIWLTGGPLLLLSANIALGETVSSATSVIAGPWALLGNAGQVVLALLLALHVTVGAILLPLLRPEVWRAALPAGFGRFAAFWVTPALLFYMLLHFGQPGYVLLLIPPAALVAGSVLAWLAGQLTLPLTSGARLVAVCALAVIAVAGSALFYLPVTPLSAPALITQRTFWQQLRDWEAADGGRPTIVLTGPTSADSFRLASYLLPGAEVFSVADSEGVMAMRYQYRPAERHGDEMARRTGMRSWRVIVLDSDVVPLLAQSARWRLETFAGRAVLVTDENALTGDAALHFRSPS